MAIIHNIRLGAFVISIISSLVVLGLSANLVTLTTEGFFFIYTGYNAMILSLTTSVMTLLFVGTSMVIDHFRKGAISSLIWVELACIGLLWVLWLATAGTATSLGFGDCSIYIYTDPLIISPCKQDQAVQAFSWLLWLTLLGWFITLLTVSIMASRRNPRVWFASVVEYPFGTGGSNKGEKHVLTPQPQYTGGSTNSQQPPYAFSQGYGQMPHYGQSQYGQP
ncbi:hypothetical protein FRC03_009527 [Tulasnella sp. 419]|nr:hypothetical protein FRC03_009527 [Tulasnella sp. 419]